MANARPDLDALQALLDKATATGEYASGYELGTADEAAREILARMPALLAHVRELGRKCEPRRDLSGSTHWDIAEVGAICHSECAVAQIQRLAARVRELERERDEALGHAEIWHALSGVRARESGSGYTQGAVEGALDAARRAAALAMRERCAQACEEAAQTRLSEGHDAPTMAAVCAAAIRQCAEGLR